MKKAIYVLAFVFLQLIMLFGMYIIINNTANECKLIHIDDNMKLWQTENVVPDGDTAKKIADIVFSVHFNEHFEFAQLYEYEVGEVSFNKQNNEWVVSYWPIHPDGKSFVGGNIDIHIKKDSGMVVEMALHQG